MDERKREIEELEKSKRDSLAALDLLLEQLGEDLLSRMGAEERLEESAICQEAGTYRRLRKNIAGSEAAIKAIEEQIRRLKELDEKISLKEREDGEQAKNLVGLYGRLGKALMEDFSGKYEAFTEPFREQADALITKVRSLEERLSELEGKEGSNVFAWIGKSAHGLVLRSFLTKAGDSLEQLYRACGERYGRRETTERDLSAPSAIADLNTEIENAREQARALSKDLASLRDERRRIADSVGAEGGPQKQIQSLKKNIDGMEEELNMLYRHFGEDAAAPQRKECFESFISGENQKALDDAAGIRQTIRDADERIEKLRASLAIDEEQAKIEKCLKLIEDRKTRIAAAERDIAEFEEHIKDSEKYIADLQKQL